MFSVLSSHFLPQEQCNSLILWKLQFPFETSWTYLKSLLFFFHMQYFKKNNAVWWQQIPFHTLLTFILILIFVKYYTPCPSRKAGCPSSSLWSSTQHFGWSCWGRLTDFFWMFCFLSSGFYFLRVLTYTWSVYFRYLFFKQSKLTDLKIQVCPECERYDL